MKSILFLTEMPKGVVYEIEAHLKSLVSRFPLFSGRWGSGGEERGRGRRRGGGEGGVGGGG